MKEICKKWSTNRYFEWLITLVILVNAALIGVETYTTNATIQWVQGVILGIFTLEIVIRYIAADGVRDFLRSGWNVFDLSLVLIGYIPEGVAANASMAMALRVLRVFRVLRLLRACKEVKLMVAVLVKSMSALFYNMLFFGIFIYLFAIMGVAMFKLPNPDSLAGEAKVQYEQFEAAAPHAPSNSPDPFGSLHEATFTLFRVMTGDDWTDVRYNLITASEHGLIKVSPGVITTYHVGWFVISAFLLLNLVVGAVVNNYQIAMEEMKKPRPE